MINTYILSTINNTLNTVQEVRYSTHVQNGMDVPSMMNAASAAAAAAAAAAATASPLHCTALH